MTNKLIAVIILMLITPSVFASTLSVGTALSFLDITDNDFEYTSNQDQLQLTSINFGINQNISDSPFIATISTNRFINRKITREVRNKKSGKIFTNKTKILADSLSIGYKIGQYIPNIGITNVDVNKSIYYAGELVGAKQQHAILSMFGLTYILNRNMITNITILAPNKELGVKSGIVFGFNYNFEL